nr:unnamed protein product [Naegleria fowleri]
MDKFSILNQPYLSSVIFKILVVAVISLVILVFKQHHKSESDENNKTSQESDEKKTNDNNKTINDNKKCQDSDEKKTITEQIQESDERKTNDDEKTSQESDIALSCENQLDSTTLDDSTERINENITITEQTVQEFNPSTNSTMNPSCIVSDMSGNNNVMDSDNNEIVTTTTDSPVQENVMMTTSHEIDSTTITDFIIIPESDHENDNVIKDQTLQENHSHSFTNSSTIESVNERMTTDQVALQEENTPHNDNSNGTTTNVDVTLDSSEHENQVDSTSCAPQKLVDPIHSSSIDCIFIALHHLSAGE